MSYKIEVHTSACDDCTMITFQGVLAVDRDAARIWVLKAIAQLGMKAFHVTITPERF